MVVLVTKVKGTKPYRRQSPGIQRRGMCPVRSAKARGLRKTLQTVT